MQIKIHAYIGEEDLKRAGSDIGLNEDALAEFMGFSGVTLFVALDRDTGKVKGIQLDDTYPLINPIDNEMLKSIMEFRQMWKDLNTARTKVEILVKEVDDEMRTKEKAGIQWNRSKCAAWEAMTDAANVSGKLRARHGV